jgi:monooxygenase
MIHVKVKHVKVKHVKVKHVKVKHLESIVIGSGVSGIAAGYYLAKNNINYLILEQANEIGGTWRDHNFHGCRVDTENVEYCFSFNVQLDEKTRWNKSEVLNYLKDTSIKFNIFENILFNKKIKYVNFSTLKNKWYVYCDDGTKFSCNYLFNCSGFSNTDPHIPKFDINKYEGKMIHAIHLDNKDTFYDKDVVVVGSGATMASLVPSLSKVCKTLRIVQRSPTYIYESADKPDLFYNVIRKMVNLSIFTDDVNTRILKLYTIYRMIYDEILFWILRNLQPVAKCFFRRQWTDIKDDKYINKHLTPKHNILEQRIPVANGFKDLLKTNKIKMTTGTIDYFKKQKIIVDQKKYKCDVAILCTGFNINFFRFPIQIDKVDVDTKKLNWYKGLMMGGIPNYFQAIGCFDCSWTQRIESCYKLSCTIINHMKDNKFNNVFVPIDRNKKNNYIFTPNFILRHKETLPVVYDITFIPTLDYFFSFNFEKCNELIFSK